MSLNQLSSIQLRQAVQLREQIDSLEGQLNSILSGSGGSVSRSDISSAAKAATSSRTSGAGTSGGKGTLGRRKMSPAARRRIAEAQRARWAAKRSQTQVNSGEGAKASAIPSSVGATGGKAKRIISPEARARMTAAQKARWAKQEKSGEPIVRSEAIALPKKKGGLTAEGRARLAEAMRARWTSAKKKGAPVPNAKAK